MKVVILAAGLGTRLGTLIPKPLTSIKDEVTILDHQINLLSQAVGIDNIYVVVGYKKELIMEKIPEVTFVYNHAFTQNNTGKSLLTALRKIDDDVLWMNGDVFFDKDALQLILGAKHSAMLVDTKKCGEEEIKYTLNDQGNIVDLSKQVKNGQGEAVGVNVIKRQDLPRFVKELEAIERNDYFEKALENLTRRAELVLKPIQLGDVYCREIDFAEDLAEVQTHLVGQRAS